MTDDEIYALTTTNRRKIAALLDGFDDDQWAALTLCPGWTVHHMAAHFLQPMVVGFGQFLRAAFRHRGDTDKTVAHVTERLARKSRADLIALLDKHAGDRVSPTRVGPMGPFAETCIHLRDIARPLGLDADVPDEHWLILLDYLTSSSVAPALVPAGRLDGLALLAADGDWQSGVGEELRGPAEALAMGAAGRVVALDDLTGNGVTMLRRRLAATE
ncbi:maleylpyruvate isomerase family mycothiol-dependent enzyme [Phytoactinopolyspora mesophila]|uniref:Maleylpyruvate isomerase family mycothiol-dependent enzyme n=1 Tax=Phytoactinopolyspora mesophila TaxID=2650750 RepID=A0A7K3M1M5_9ACTN|nr:maleylpyruvate isomerase family mycothiol-dependent enzyme [Phytoactinopolyspora mesophila]NDL57184.1 maleylpyruvate isomerase family mycothiol-dependent enzyme [Phytoactinopolyspora mesophila]